MKIFRNVSELRGTKINSVSVGTFDGVHIGHIAIVNELIKLQPSLVVTFEPHPRELLFAEANTKQRLTTIEERAKIFNSLGIENMLILNFDSKLASMSADEFIKWLFVDCMKPKRVIIGYNHRFGKNGVGNFEYLRQAGKKYGFQVLQVAQVIINETPVSSSIIRKKIAEGKLYEAKTLLGRPYSISSKVIAGQKIGRKLDYPTANLTIPENKLLPKSGVYAVWVEYNDSRFQGMLSIGEHPTFNKPFGLEVHIIDFPDTNEELLHSELKIDFVKFIRKNRKFNTPDELKLQLGLDKHGIKNCLQQA